MTTKNAYHSDLILQHQLGILSQHLKHKIPSSTLHNWKNRDFNQLIGSHLVNKEIELIKQLAKYRKLLTYAKALYIIYQTLQQILNASYSSSQLLHKFEVPIIRAVDKTKAIIGMQRALKAFNISSKQYYYHKVLQRSCTDTFFNLCKHFKPQQLLKKEVETIKKYLTEPKYLHWSLTAVYYQALKDKALFINIQTWYKYARLLKINRKKCRNRHKKHTKGIRASHVAQILHMDLTIFKPLNQQKVFIYLVVDNFSRKILAYRAALECKAQICFQNLQQAFDDFNLYNSKDPISLLVDDGSENKGEVTQFLASKRVNVQKLIAQKDIHFSNSMIEAVNQRLKYQHLFPTPLKDFEAVVVALPEMIEAYNNKPNGALFGCTPDEVYYGKQPNKHEFSQQIAQAKKDRIAVNQSNRCSNCKS